MSARKPEVNEEMLEAGLGVLADFDASNGNPRDLVEQIFCAMLLAWQLTSAQ
jgi:hypothetical protein